MKYLLLGMAIIAISCHQINTKDSEEKKSDPNYEQKKQHFIDSVINHGKEMAADMDLASNIQCPVAVEATLSDGQYNKKEFHIKMTNNSQKTIDAIEVSVICYNNFNEQVQDGSMGGSYVNVKYQEKIRPGSTRSADYSTFYFKEATKGKAFVNRIHFTDGSTWKK